LSLGDKINLYDFADRKPFATVQACKPGRSGDQKAATAMQAALAEHLAFSYRVDDFVLNPIIESSMEHDHGTIIADAFFKTWAGHRNLTTFFLVFIEGDDEAVFPHTFTDQERDSIQRWCRKYEALAYVLTPVQLETELLKTIRFLKTTPISMECSKPYQLLMHMLDQGPLAYGKAVDELSRKAKIPQSLAVDTIKETLRQRLTFCDLTQPFKDETKIVDAFGFSHGIDVYDPIMRMVILGGRPLF